MPYIHVKTNVAMEKPEKVKAALGEIVAIIPGKSESRTMVCLEERAAVYFGGSEAPCAMVETLVNRGTDHSCNGEYCSAVVQLLSRELQIPENRIYVTVNEQDFWYSVR